jgi:leader peptidase (prepilin peptidase)/N-methyltransferase
LGDAKLAALIGAWLGPLGLGLAVAVAVSSGAVVGLLGRLSGRLSRQQAIPFGPFLVLGALGLWWLGPAPFLRLLALA